MSRRLGPYAPLSATYAADDAIMSAGEAAELLYVRGLAFCASSESDGYITEAQLVRFVGAGMRDATKRAGKLASVGLWERVEGGYMVRAWLKWNRSSDDLGRARKRDRERKATGVRRADDVEPGLDSAHDSRGSPPGNVAESVGNPDGFQPRAPAYEARARPIHATALHATSRHATVVPTESARTGPDEAPETTQVLVAEWLDSCRERPPGRVIGQVSKEIKAMLTEGIAYANVRHGLAIWAAKGLNPAVLASVVNEVMNGSGGGPNVGSGKQRANDQILSEAWANAKAAEARNRT